MPGIYEHEVFGDYLQRHAYKYIWCTPDQDRQMILKPAKISPPGGVWSDFRHMWRKMTPPRRTGIFHIYQIGQVHPTLLGLMNERLRWIPVTDAMRRESVMVDIYTGNGIQVPRCLCWYQVTRDDNLILAIERLTDPLVAIPQNIETQDVYMRLYSNAYFQSLRADGIENPILVGSRRVYNVNDINTVQAEVAAVPTDRGAVIHYVNGKKVDDFDLVNVRVGDYLDWIYDSSIKRIVRLDLDTMPEFTSVLDPATRKALVHYPGDIGQIEYHDDMDMFLMRPSPVGNNHATGVYLHKNDKRTVRMVTHRDYSVSLERTHAASAANNHVGTQPGLKLDLYIRHSGYERPLVFESSRIQELYKLSDERVVQAMLGHNSTVPEWRAEFLENNSYTKVMRAPLGGISSLDAQEAYGYNSLSKLLGNTPSVARSNSGAWLVDIPEALRGRATVYEYDQHGLLLGWSHATMDETHGVSAACVFAEIIHGIGGDSLDIQEGTNTGTINPVYNYRFYSCGYTDTYIDQKWVDETGTGDYIANRSTFEWVAVSNRHRRVMSNAKHLALSFDLSPIDGVFEFLVPYRNPQGNVIALEMPLGNLDIFLNGYSLIEGIDFLVVKNHVVITNKEYLINNGTGVQKIFVRYTDFAPPDFIRKYPEDRGYVWHGVLSANNRFDLRDDRVLRIVCRGQVRLRNELKFAEDGITVSITNALNGSPYSIRDIVVPMNNYLVNPEGIDDSTFEMREKASVIDKKISDYMTLFKPQEQVTEPNAHPLRLVAYSPFLARILSHMQSGLLWDPVLEESFTDQDLARVLAPYEYLLDYDLIGRKNGWDNRYVVVHPHTDNRVIRVDAHIYRVMRRASQYYSDGLVDVSSHFVIKEI